MRFSTSSLSVAGLVLALGSVLVIAAPAKPTTKPHGEGKLVGPWNRLSSLNDEQKTRIVDLHAKANDQVKAIRAKENNEIMALLTPEQRDEFKKIQDQDRKMAREKAAARKAESGKGKHDGGDGDDKKPAEHGTD